MSVAGRVRQERGAVTAQLCAPFLLGALSVALLAQGAYYLRAQLYVAALVGAALLVSAGLTGLTSRDRAIAFPIGGLAGWAVIDAAVHDNMRTAVPYVALLAGVVALLLTCSRLDDDARHLLLAGLIGCGILVALLGWLGLAFHLARWTWQGQGLWRASSTLTYPNATAIILAMLALVVLSMLTEAPRSIPLLLGATVILTGLAATLSRAGLLAFAVGVLVLSALLGPRLLLRAGGAAVLGAAVAAIGLVPAMTTGTRHPAAAVLALGAIDQCHTARNSPAAGSHQRNRAAGADPWRGDRPLRDCRYQRRPADR